MLNIVSCISVIILHTTNHPVHWWDGETNMLYLWGMMTHTLFICAVPLFLMLSGANLLNKDIHYRQFYKRRFERVGIPFLFWSLLYWPVIHLGTGLKGAWELFISGRMNPHMWFFIPLFSIYLSMPVIRIFIKHASRRDIEIYLLFSLVFTSLLPFFFNTIDLAFPGYIFPVANQYLFMAVLGYYLNSFDINVKNKTLLLIYCATALFHLGYLLVRTQLSGHSDETILHYEVPSIMIMSSCIFLLFKNAEWKFSERAKSIIVYLASCSLGVYLIHCIFVTYIPVYTPFLHNCYWEFAVVYVLSILLTATIKNIPWLRKCV